MKPTVLIVDDDEDFLSCLNRSLKRGGFSVLTASDGCDVPDILSNSQVDVLILDLQMPGMNGWEVIRSLSGRSAGCVQVPETGRPKILVVSGRDDDETAS